MSFATLFGAVLSPFLIFVFLLIVFSSAVHTKRFEILFFYSIYCIFYGNVFSAILIYQYSDISYKLIRGLDFASIFLLFCYCFYFYERNRKEFLLFFTGVLLFSIVGVFRSSGDAALLYLRIFLTPICLAYIFLTFKKVQLPKELKKHFNLAVFMFVTLNLLAVIFIHDFSNFINMSEYISRKYNTQMNYDTFFYMKLFNSDLFSNIWLLRFYGFTLHPISSAYIFAAIFILFYEQRRYLLAFGCFTLILFTFSKGALIFVFSYIMLKKLLVFGKLYIYAYLFTLITSFILYGLVFNDPHVYSLVGSIIAFFTNPLGNGVGVGGSMYSGRIEELNFSLVRGDSAFGIVIQMLGVFGLFIFSRIFKFLKLNEVITRDNFVFLLLFFFSVFQEEVMNPYTLTIIFYTVLLKNEGNEIVKRK
jgi:hypothetical protein